MIFKKILIVCGICGFVASTTPMPKVSPMDNDYDYAYYVDDLKDIDAYDAALVIGSIIMIPLILEAIYLGYFASQGDALDSVINHYEDATRALEATVNVLTYDNEVLKRQLASVISSR